MKIQQENEQFKPVTITLETRSEAKALFDLMDKLDLHRTTFGYGEIEFTKDEISIVIALSDARFTGTFLP